MTDRATLGRVQVGQADINSYRSLLDGGAWTELERAMKELASRLRGRTIWNVNSTARGGGVAELLSSLIPYERGSGIDERWLTIDGAPAYFDVTKKIHTFLHGVASDGSEISRSERNEYERTMARNATALVDTVKGNDVVILHDPQSAGLVSALHAHGTHVIWRSHVGLDQPNDIARAAWDMLRPYLDEAEAYVFSRRNYVWEGLDDSRVHIIPPSIDAFTAKNRDLTNDEVAHILSVARVFEDGKATADIDGSARPVHVERKVHMSGSPIPPEVPIVVQVSRWDRLKDPLGVLDGFVRHIAPKTDGYLVLAGPAATSVRDDPEQPEVLAELETRRTGLPPAIRDRVRIAQLPMEDEGENAIVVNALQRHATVVVQKSLAEGFGLTVAEAMWKARPVVASRVGGIEDQIESGRSGILIEPDDLERFGSEVAALLEDRARAEHLGTEAKARVTREFLTPRHLIKQGRLVLSLIE